MCARCFWLGVIAIAWIVYVGYTAFDPSPIATESEIRAAGGFPFYLKDGRVIEYFLHGKTDTNKNDFDEEHQKHKENDLEKEKILIALHGAQTTGKLFSILDSWAKSKGIKIIAPSLPGFGLTTFNPNYTIEGWVQDLTELLTSLNVTGHFHVLGTSLGSIHAAALASLFEPRHAVGNVALYVPFAPADVSHDPLENSVLKIFADMRGYPLVKRLFEKLLVMPLLRTFMDGDVYRAIATQWEGMASCADVIYQPWRFDWKGLANGGQRKVLIVSGTQDNAAPPHNQKKLHAEIEHSLYIEYEGPHEQGIVEPDMLAGHLDTII